MPWVKGGLLIEPRRQAPWVGTHAALPIVHGEPGEERVYFSSRDDRNRSHVGYAALSLDTPAEPRTFSERPVLSPGALGTFDDAGVTSSCIVSHDGQLLLYYTGWALGQSVPFYLHAGLATSTDGGRSFHRISEAPLLDRSEVDPYLTASPWVLIENGLWRMWYVSGTEWQDLDGGPRHRYHIKYAESPDGVAWNRRGVVCVDYGSPEEYAFGRPCVIKDTDRYRMWFSSRGTRYQMGYAESQDGLAWTRLDVDNVVHPSRDGWDSEMVTYPVVTELPDRRLMLYNGNGFGRSGIGFATSP